MKKILSIAVLTGLSFFALSCAKETAKSGEGETQVSVSVSLPGIVTKAFADGETAKNLNYVVYLNEPGSSKDGSITISGKKEIHITTTVNLPLSVGKNYDFVFWADSGEGSPYTFDALTKKVTVNYAANNSCSDKGDAFYGHVNKTIVAGDKITCDLIRPFAQVNVGTNDLNAAAVVNSYDKLKATIKVNTYSEFDLMEGKPTGDQAEQSFVASVPASGETFPVTDYKYLAMAYVLVDPEGETQTVTYCVYDEIGGSDEEKIAEPVLNVPLKKNYRTNIYGQLLTSTVAATVTISPTPIGEENISIVSVNSVAELNAALAAGSTNVALTGPVDDTIEIPKIFATGNDAAINITLPESTNAVNINYGAQTDEAPANVNIAIASATEFVIDLVESTVTLNSETVASVGTVTASTANNTLIVGENVTIGDLDVLKGNVVIYGNVTGNLTLGDENSDAEVIWHVREMSSFKKALKIAKEVHIAAGNYPIREASAPNGKTILIKGEGDVSVIDMSNTAYGEYFAMPNCNVTFEDLKIVTSGNNYVGLEAHAASSIFNNCTIEGQLYVEGSYNSATFNKCRFDTKNGYVYTYGSPDVSFNNCIFNASEGKAIQVYNEHNGETKTFKVAVRDCQFIAAKQAQTWDGKPVTAIDINSFRECILFDIIIENSTAEGFPLGLQSGLQLYNIKNGVERVTINGETNIASGVTKKSDGSYNVTSPQGLANMRDIYNNATTSIIVNLPENGELDMTGIEYSHSAEGYYGPHPTKHITLNGNGATIKNLTVTGRQASLFAWTSQGFSVKDVTMKDCTFTGEGNVDNSYNCAAAFGAFCDVTSVSVEGCTLDNVTIGSAKYVGGFVAYCSGKTSTFTNCVVKNCKINSDYTENGEEYKGHAGGLIGGSYGATLDNCIIKDTAFSIKGLRGGIFVGSLWEKGMSGTAISSANTGLTSNVGEVGTALFTATITEE